MAFKIIRNDITKVSADAIVNTANPLPIIGGGSDASIYRAAGRQELLAARKRIGAIEAGTSAWTDSYKLKDHGVRYIIHTVAVPYADGNKGEADILRSCYAGSLQLAKELSCKSVALPLLGTGFYSFPKDIGLRIAVDEISRFLLQNEIDVILVVFDKNSYLLSEKLYSDIQTFIDDNYTGVDDRWGWHSRVRREAKSRPVHLGGAVGSLAAFVHKPLPEEAAFYEVADEAELLNSQKDDGIGTDVDSFLFRSKGNLNFQETLQRLIAERNLENTVV